MLEAECFLDAFEALLRMSAQPRKSSSEVIGWQGDEDQAIGMGGDVVEMERAFPLLGAALAEGE